MMSAAQIEIQLIASIVAVACAISGVFLVLRKMAMMSDAISHSILLGIVVAFFITRDIASPLLIIAAALTGVMTVSLVELLNRSKLVKEDASIGLVFPLLFSAGVILISRYAGNVHLDIDSVLLGELAFAPFNRFTAFGHDIGPKSMIIMSAILILNIFFLSVFYKEIKLSTFDPGLAAALGFSPALLHYGLMSMVSITAVGAFDAVGSILVVAFMIAPPATAYLLTDRLSIMMLISAFIGILCAISGYWVAYSIDASIAGSMATMAGFIFFLVFMLAPERGVIAIARRRVRQRWKFAQVMLAVHLLQHQDLPPGSYENHVDHCYKHLNWSLPFAERVIGMAKENRLLTEMDGYLALTDTGREAARQALTQS